MRSISQNLILVMIILLAALLRFFNLSTIPIGFNDDEAAFGYNAYSILQTGRDEWGRFLPFPTFESFGDWKLVGYLYPVVISQFFLGTNEFATRFPSALFGVLSVLATYLLTKELFEKRVALLAAFLLSISPWHIVASRNAFESDPLIFFITLGTYFFLKSFKNKNYLYLSAALFGVSFYVYRSSWLFVPLFTLSLIFLFKKQLKLTKIFAAKILVLTLVIVLPLMPTVLSFKGQSRFFQESFLTGIQKTGIVGDVNSRRGTCQKIWPPVSCVLVYNQYLFYFSTYLNNYISNLSPETYFIRGTGGYQSFSIRSLFYTFELPFLAIGIFILLYQKNQAAKVLLPWILIVPIGASITGIGNPGRLNILMPSVQIIVAFGLCWLFAAIKQNLVKRLFQAAGVVIIVFSLTRLAADMFIYYPQISGSYQRYGYRQLFDYLESQKTNYREIAISRKTDDAKQYIHYLFFEKIDPNKFFDPKATMRYRGRDNWQQVEKIDNINFYKETPDIFDLPPKTILAVAHNEISLPDKPIFQVNYLNGDVVFEVYDVDQVKSKLNEK